MPVIFYLSACFIALLFFHFLVRVLGIEEPTDDQADRIMFNLLIGILAIGWPVTIPIAIMGLLSASVYRLCRAAVLYFSRKGS